MQGSLCFRLALSTAKPPSPVQILARLQFLSLILKNFLSLGHSTQSGATGPSDPVLDPVPPASQRCDSSTDNEWTPVDVVDPLDSNSSNFNGKDAAGRMRTGVCTTGGQGVAGSNPVIPTNKYRVESTCSVQPFSVCSHFVARLWHGSGICQRTAAI